MAAPPTKKIVFKVPKTLGACADALYDTRNARLVLQKQVDELAEREVTLKDHIIAELPKSQAGGIAGRLARVTLGKKIIPRVDDWDAFYKYILKTKDFSLLQRRTGDAAIAERWDAKKKVPGVDAFTIITVSINKV